MLEWIGAWPGADLMRRVSTVYIFVNAAHILGIALLVGPILALDLRILGAFRQVPLAAIGPYLSRTAMVGAALAVLTGTALFSVRPAEYAGNAAFLIKLGLLATGALNALALQFGAGWKAALASGEANPALKLQAMVSVLAWLGTLLAGRWIGFV